MTTVTSDWRYTVGLVTGGHFLSHFYLLVFPPLFPLLRADFGMTNTEFGLLMSVLSVPMLLQLPVGRLVDRVGAKWVFVVGTAVTSAGIAAASLADAYLLLVVAAAASGVGQSAFHPADYALLGSVTDENSEGKSFGVHTFGGYVGFAAAPVVVGGLGLAFGWAPALLAVGLVGVAFAAFAALTLDPAYRRQLQSVTAENGAASEAETTETTADEPAAAPTPDGRNKGVADALRFVAPTIVALFVFFTVFNMAGKGIQTFTIVLVVERFGLPETVGNTTLTVFFAAAAAGILVGGVLADRFDPRRLVVATLGTAGVLILTVLAGGVPSTPLAVVTAFAVIGFVVGLAYPSRDRLVTRYGSSGSQGTSFGFVFTGMSLGGLVSPALIGAVGDATSVSVAYVIVAASYIVAAGVVLALGWRVRLSPSALASEGD